MHTLRTRIDDEIDYFGPPDIEIAPTMWCEECRRRTLFRRDMDGIPICREHTQDEVAHV